MQKTSFYIHRMFVLGAVLASMLFISPARAQETPIPTLVGLAGTHQDELGCPAEWQPGCPKTLLAYDAEDDVWQALFEIQPANDGDKQGPRYKVALNGAWDENYGRNASRGGTDIPLLVTAPGLVKFYYDHKTHWVTDNFNTPIIVAVGDFQTSLGCKKNEDAACLRSWLEDPEGDGIFSFTTRALSAGDYSVSLAKNEQAGSLLAEKRSFTVKKNGDEIYFGYDTVKNEFTINTDGAPKGNLTSLASHWVRRDTILWNVTGSPRYTYSLFYSPDAALELTADGILGGVEIPLTYMSAGPDADIKTKFPHLASYTTLRLADADLAKVPEALKGETAVAVRDQNGKIVDVSGLQTPGVLDDLYTYSGALGVTFDGDTPSLSLWAPTARSVTLHLFADAARPAIEKLPMKLDMFTGVWTLDGTSTWIGKYYLYEVEVYVPSIGRFVKSLVTDPYSISLSTNSLRSQIVDLSSAALQPQGWQTQAKPPLAAPEDIVIYELHIRDFSSSDASIPEKVRGTYLAFTNTESDGMRHLISLAKAGLTHIHLLPAFDIASVNEDKSTWQTVDGVKLAAFPPDSDQQQLAVSAISGTDAFNWGYDPFHYTTPEGSYATDANSSVRILEFRQMVQALNQNGLRVVMDVVYNHTNASGLDEKSVLDKVVPGYYHRLDGVGKVEQSTCCSNTATEHNMMRKLMIDSLVSWAREYKVDGFRFDLMGHHMLADMQAARAALDALTMEKDGVDGKSIYMYGEGWNFGEVANNSRGANAVQQNIGGTGIGVFNDRIRDALRGGSPFGDILEQGFVTGLYFQPNSAERRDARKQKSKMLDYADWIRISLAGNLQNYEIIRANGDKVSARLVLYNGSAAGYTLDPQENIIYAAAHDNETLWDIIQIKASSQAALEERVRMNNLALSLVAFSQGVPFFHAGDDLLRSKSLDRNSYNSGDWFNRLDWTYNSNNWGIGLPSEGRDKWDLFRPLLANPALKVSKGDITFTSQVFRDFLQIRKSSPLFRLRTADDVHKVVSFLNTGPNQIPGLIVMRLTDSGNLDPHYRQIVVLFNAAPQTVRFSADELKVLKFELHPVQAASTDEVMQQTDFDTSTGTFSVPGRTTAVFVLPDEKNASVSAAAIPQIAYPNPDTAYPNPDTAYPNPVTAYPNPDAPYPNPAQAAAGYPNAARSFMQLLSIVVALVAAVMLIFRKQEKA